MLVLRFSVTQMTAECTEWPGMNHGALCMCGSHVDLFEFSPHPAQRSEAPLCPPPPPPLLPRDNMSVTNNSSCTI